MPFDATTSQMPLYQQTLRAPVDIADIGLHSGTPVHMRLLPGTPNGGIVFIRTDMPSGQNIIPARWDFVVDTRLCTVIGNEFGARVGTVEHVLSALAGLGVDNCVVEIDGEEVPALDGSANLFIAAIDKVGLVTQAAPRRALEILRSVEVTDGQKHASYTPTSSVDRGSHYAVTVDYEHSNKRIGRQSAGITLAPATYRTEIASARTFTLFEELEAMWNHGLGRGGSLDNAVVVWGDQVVNNGGLRYETEFARHKLLDAVGDLALAGGPIIGAYAAYMTGHAMNARLLRAVFADPSNYRWVDMTADMTVDIFGAKTPNGLAESQSSSQPVAIGTPAHNAAPKAYNPAPSAAACA